MGTSAVFPWIVRHAACLYNRCQVKADGKTPFEAVHQRSFTQPLYAFGTLVLGRVPSALEFPKLEARWRPGLWLGRRCDSDDHLVGTAHGIMQTRACREMFDADRALLDAMVWTPWEAEARLPGATGVVEEERPRGAAPAGTLGATGPMPYPTAPLGKASLGSRDPGRKTSACPRTQEIRDFLRESKPTIGCKACQHGASGNAHSRPCWARRAIWMQQRWAAARPVPDDQMGIDEAHPPQPLPTEATAGKMFRRTPPMTRVTGKQSPCTAARLQLPPTSTETNTSGGVSTAPPVSVTKPPGRAVGTPSLDVEERHEEMPEEDKTQEAAEASTVRSMNDDDDGDDDEEMPWSRKRALEEDGVELVSVVGPPWYDAYTEQKLDNQKVEVAMQSEVNSFKKFEAMEDFPENELAGRRVIHHLHGGSCMIDRSKA